MKKLSLSLLVSLSILSIFLFPGCKKSSDDSSTTTVVLSAYINSTYWEPDTLSANINYNAASKKKVFSFVGTIGQKRLAGSITVNNSTNTNAFTTGSYPIDATGNSSLLYSIQQKDSNGNYVFVPFVAAASGDGYINISSVNTSGYTITGTFAFTHKVINYDANGNVTSVSNNVISSGTITSMPYTFTNN